MTTAIYRIYMVVQPESMRAVLIVVMIIAAFLGFSPSIKGAETAEVSNAHDDTLTASDLGKNGEDQSKFPLHDQVSAATIKDLVAWIKSSTEYDVKRTLNNLPSLSFANSGEVISYEGKSLLVNEDVRALYDSQSRVIYLIRPWSESEVIDVSSLLHELVHDVQFLNHRWSCSNKAEWEAYKLQAKWLDEQQVKVKFNWVQIAFLSQCFHSDHT
ncbi:MAG: DUF6647 family protein [Aestuariivirga sp.]